MVKKNRYWVYDPLNPPIRGGPRIGAATVKEAIRIAKKKKWVWAGPSCKEDLVEQKVEQHKRRPGEYKYMAVVRVNGMNGMFYFDTEKDRDLFVDETREQGFAVLSATDPSIL